MRIHMRAFPDRANTSDQDSDHTGWIGVPAQSVIAKVHDFMSDPNQQRRDDLQDGELSNLDRKLTGVYSEASRKAANEHPPTLKAEQRGWIKGRDDCWKSTDKRQCVGDSYTYRIAELQAKYRLVSATSPIVYACDGNRSNEVVATFFQTDPPTLIAEHGDSVSLMYAQPSGSGSKYQGRNESFWEHQGEAVVTWGYEAPEMRCKKALTR